MSKFKEGEIFKVTSSNSSHPELVVDSEHRIIGDIEYCPITKAHFYGSDSGWYMEDSSENEYLTIQSSSDEVLAILTKKEVSDT